MTDTMNETENTLNVEINQRAIGCVSFSLWGDESKYTLGIIENAKLMPEVYPGWVMRVYVSRGHYIIPWLLDLDVEVFEMDPAKGSFGMFWRFLAAACSDFPRVIVRDADSRINPREAAAVEEWIRSGKSLHVMRDHYWHLQKPIIGGCWGIKTGVFDMVNAINAWPHNFRYDDDEAFLADLVWPAFYPNDFLRHSIEVSSQDDTSFPSHGSWSGHVCERVTPQFTDWRGRAVVLNPDRFPNRLARFYESLERNGAFLRGHCERARATSLNELVVPRHFPHADSHPHYFAATRDHVRIIENAIVDNVEYLIVFEDDAEILPCFEEYFSQMWLALPEGWMGAMLGGQPWSDNARRAADFPEALAWVNGCLGMHATLYSRAGLLRAYEHFTFWHRETIDQAFAGLQREEHNWFAPARWIVGIAPEASQFASGDSPPILT